MRSSSVLALVLVACGKPINIFTVEDDISLGEQVRDEVLADPEQYPILDPRAFPDAYAHLDRLAGAILDNADVAHVDQFPWEFWLIDDPETLNAFAAPGGFVFVYTGIIQFLAREDDLEGVLGHEIAHAAERHSTELLTQAYGISLLLDIALGDGTDRDIAEIAAGLGTLAFSRDHETEADEYSVRYLCETDYAADGAASFFEALGAQDVPEFLSTHPSNESRVEDIRALADELGCDTTANPDAQWQAFLDSLP